MDKLRRKTGTEGISANERLYSALTPVKLAMELVFIGLCFAGGNFCNFCPMVSFSPILAGMSTSLYVSGFIMILVLIGGFFRHRLFCNVCPECGACYETCPMGIRQIYTERGKADVTDANCIMCGECIRCCPEDKALTITCAGVKLYTSSRKEIMSGYSPEK